MDIAEKYELVLQADNFQALADVIKRIADDQGLIYYTRHNPGINYMIAETVSKYVLRFEGGNIEMEALPIAYGIRQQAFYLKHGYIEITDY